MLVNHDILWLQTVPSIAAIYYHTYLESTHVLFCPDDRKKLDDLTVRDLGRSILNVLNSNNKKIAVHFMRPCSLRKHEDILRFLVKMRSELTIKCTVLPVAPIQTSLLAGWAMTLGDVSSRNLWIRRCLVPYNEEAFSSPSENNEWITEYSQPFCITDNEFIKRALIVNITASMCTSKSGPGLSLNDGAVAAIQGWADVVKQQSLPGTIVLIADEKIIFKGMNNVPGEAQNRDLQRQRESTSRFLEKLGTECPLYLYTRDYKSTIPESTMQKIASIQHRHHLWLSGSYVLNWSRDESGLETNCPEFIAQMRHFYLVDALVPKSRAIWKNDFLEILQRKSEIQPDIIKHISPSNIDTEFSGKDESSTPLLYSPSNKLTREEAYMGIVRQSVSAANIQVFDSWKAQMQHIEAQRAAPEPMQSILFENDKLSNKPSENSVDDEEAIIQLRYRFADLIDNEIIANYIDNKGAYKRGEAILGKITDMMMAGDDENIDIWAKARGTAADAYDVTMTIAFKSKKETEFRDGHCSCPVGKKGRCKHCTALLLRYMVNADEFEYVSRSQRPQPSTEQSKSLETLTQKQPSTTPTQKPLSTTSMQEPSSTTVSKSNISIERSIDLSIDDELSIISPQPSTENGTSIKEEREPSPEIVRPKAKRILPWQVQKDNEPKATKKGATKKGSEMPKKPAKRKKVESDQEEPSDAQPVKARAVKPRATTSRRKKKIKEESTDDDHFEIYPVKLSTSKRTVTRRKKVVVSDEDEHHGGFAIAPGKSTSRNTTAEVKMEISEDEDNDEFEIRPQKSTLRNASASPSIAYDSFPGDTQSQQVDEDVDSDATDDGLGVVYRRSNTSSQMSVDQYPLTKTSSSSDIDMTTSANETNTINDPDKIQTFHSGAMTTDDLFDELGL